MPRAARPTRTRKGIFNMVNFLVVSPLMSVTIPIMDDGAGPTEYFRCVVQVDAPNKREALRLAVKHPDMAAWVEEQRGDGLNPFSGLKAEAYTK